MIKSLLKNYNTTVREIIMQASTNSVDFEFKKSWPQVNTLATWKDIQFV